MYSKAKKDFAKLGKVAWQNQNNLLDYVKGNDTSPGNKNGIDKGCKICYNVYIADTTDRKCPHKKIKFGAWQVRK